MPRPYLTFLRTTLSWLRRAGWAGVAAVALLIAAGPVTAATMFYVQGGGDGHGIGMSQYGAYGYALHGKDYRWILAHYYTGTSLGTTNPSRTIRVLLASGSASFSGASSAPGKKLNPASTYYVRPLGNGGVALLGARGRTLAKFSSPITVIGNGPLYVPGLGRYRGALQFRPDGAGGIETVNALDLEDYVRGVISAEMPSGWSPEALKVQAVAARTYAITTTVNRGAFDVYSDTRSQMYRGVAAEGASTNAAVAATRGQIVTYNGAPAITYFSASTGGWTESIEDAWPGSTPQPWLRGVPDPVRQRGRQPVLPLDLQLLDGRAQAKLGRWVKGQLIGVQIVTHAPDPRMVSANVVGTGGTTRVSANSLESLFGLLSTYASFTTVTTLPGMGAPPRCLATPSPAGRRRRGCARPLVHSLVADSVPGLHGTVFPGHAGDPVTVQMSEHGGWQTVPAPRSAPAAATRYRFRAPAPTGSP